MTNIAFQPELSPAIPTVYGSKDYNEFRWTLEEMDRILTESGIEHSFIIRQIFLREKRKPTQKRYGMYRAALRYGILLAITQFSYRRLAFAVADSNLFQWFVRAAQIDGVRPCSKSTIERLEKLISSEEIRELVDNLNKVAADKNVARELLYRETEDGWYFRRLYLRGGKHSFPGRLGVAARCGQDPDQCDYPDTFERFETQDCRTKLLPEQHDLRWH